ncbi:MAG: alkaline phosphatase [Cytophagaceae bacterium SCN 52-12]|nr:MAG: alkaline phosphatase [Cytophagaceae bacterium SCN 52-12]
MKRRDFFRNSSLAFIGTSLLPGGSALYTQKPSKGKKAKNIIFIVSDGMSTGTLNMADLLLQRKEGRRSTWLKLYEENQAVRALVDTSSASGLVTDSAAGSSAWGGGVKVPNGSLNVNADGSFNKPILQKFKQAGKSVGCVTTVPVTHATPAGFSVNSASRGSQDEIAQQYLGLKFDVLLGGGREFFSSGQRKDKADVFGAFSKAGYNVVHDRDALLGAGTSSKPLLGAFVENGLPFALDASADREILAKIPSLAEMATAAITRLSKNPKGFALQIEGGKVDWAAHSNDIGGLLYDQIALDEALKAAIDFAKKDGETLVIFTTDHGNANPGLFGKDSNFDRIQTFKNTNDWILRGITHHFKPAQVIERIEAAQGYAIKKEEAELLLTFYTEPKEEGLYNPYKLPFRQLGEIQGDYTSVGWAGTGHSADFVELGAFGPGSELIRPHIKNSDLHNIMLTAAEVAHQ